MATYGEDIKMLTTWALYTETIKSKTGTTGISIADAGAVTIGIAGGSEIHTVHGGTGGLKVVGQDTGVQFVLGRTNTSVGWGYLGANNTNALSIYAGGTGSSPSLGSELFSVSQAGAIGIPTVTTHTFGADSAGRTTVVVSGATGAGNSANFGIYVGGVSKAAIGCYHTNEAIVGASASDLSFFAVQNMYFSTGGGGVNHGSCVSGAWIIGPIAGGVDHIAYGDSFKIKRTSATANNLTAFNISPTPTEVYLDCYGDDSSTNGSMIMRTLRSDGTNPIEFLTSSSSGIVTIGAPSGLTTSHVIRNSSTASGDMVLSIRKLAVAKNQNNTYYMGFYGSDGEDGYLQTNGSAVLSLVDVSDIRKKENIRPASYGLTTIMQLNPVEFDWKSGVKNVKGFIAQDVKQVLPESVSIRDNSKNGGFEDDHYLETQTMIPVVVKAIQELAAKVAALEAK